MCIVRKGEVDVIIRNANSNEIPQTALAEGSERMLLKTVRAEGSLLSMSTMLSLLIKKDPLMETEAISVSSTTAKMVGRLDFQAAEDVELYVVPIADFMKLLSIHPTAELHILQAVIRRYYFVTFPICRSHFGLHDQVLACERAIHQFCSAGHGHLFLTEPMMCWLRENHQTKSDGRHLDTTRGMVLPDLDRVGASPVALDQTPEAPATGDRASTRTLSDFRGRPAYREPLKLRLRTSSFLKAPGSDPVSGQLFSPLSRAEYSPFARSRSRSRNHPVETPRMAAYLRKEIMRAILINLGVKPCLDVKPEHQEFKNQMDNSLMINTTFSRASPIRGENIEALVREYRDQVEIVYFPGKSILVREGERNPGLYYVLDGSLVARSSMWDAGFCFEQNERVGIFQF